MAVRTHSAVESHSAGNLRLSIITFTDIDTADTYTSGIPGALAYWAAGTDSPTINLEDVAVTYEEDIPDGQKNGGRFTFQTQEDNRAVKLYVLARA